MTQQNRQADSAPNTGRHDPVTEPNPFFEAVALSAGSTGKPEMIPRSTRERCLPGDVEGWRSGGTAGLEVGYELSKMSGQEIIELVRQVAVRHLGYEIEDGWFYVHPANEAEVDAIFAQVSGITPQYRHSTIH